MKKICSFFAAFCLFGIALAAPKDTLRVEDSAHFEQGIVEKSTVLTDENATIFIEFPRTIQAVEKLTKSRFTGELLSPKEIEKPAKHPKTRMDQYFSFEILSGEGEVLQFSDRVSGRRSITQYQIDKNPEEYVAGALPIMVFVTTSETARKLALWKFISEEKGWKRIGGVQEGDADAKEKILTVKLPETGTYTIFDEWPLPSGENSPYEDNYVETLEFLELQQIQIANQIASLKAAGVTSLVELRAQEALENSENEAIGDDNLFEDGSEFRLDSDLFPDGENTIPAVEIPDTTFETTPKAEVTPIDPTAKFGLGATTPLGELSLNSFTANGANNQPKTLTTPTGETIDQPIGATLPEAGASNWWSWNLAILILFLSAIIGGSWWVIKENS